MEISNICSTSWLFCINRQLGNETRMFCNISLPVAALLLPTKSFLKLPQLWNHDVRVYRRRHKSLGFSVYLPSPFPVPLHLSSTFLCPMFPFFTSPPLLRFLFSAPVFLHFPFFTFPQLFHISLRSFPQYLPSFTFPLPPHILSSKLLSPPPLQLHLLFLPILCFLPVHYSADTMDLQRRNSLSSSQQRPCLSPQTLAREVSSLPVPSRP